MAVAIIGQPDIVLAHAGAPIAPHDLWSSWNLSPWILGGLFVLAWLYARGLAGLWRSVRNGRVVPLWRMWAFSGGLLALVVALISPLDAIAGSLFAAHMAQHLLLTLVAAPLLVAAAVPLPILWALPRTWRPRVGRWSHASVIRAAGRVLTDPIVISLLYASVLWIWHWPRLFEAALLSEGVHALEHATMLGTALLFWWVLMQPLGRRRTSQGVGILMVFAAMLHGIALGALIAFADTAWYGPYLASASTWGISAIEDQRLAGSLMLMPAGLAYLGGAVFLLTGWLRAAERRQARTHPLPTTRLASELHAGESGAR